MIRQAINIIMALAFGALIMVTPPMLNLISKYQHSNGCDYALENLVGDLPMGKKK